VNFHTIEWKNDSVVMIDQRKLPDQEIYNEYKDYAGVATAIKDMVIRGAPAIGVAAAMGIALGVRQIQNREEFKDQLECICKTIKSTRPTAVNLFWAVDRMKHVYQQHKKSTLEELKELFKEEALKIWQEDIDTNQKIGSFGQDLIGDNATLMTHCNAGALATAGHGTALGVIYSGVQSGKKLKVFVCETRPFLQGARLTAWELTKNNIPVTLITDNMAGYFMRYGAIEAVIVGADRIAANGDVANKIGTYGVAVLANRHKIPFYVAAPTSTIDLQTATGDDIPIEERDVNEVTMIGEKRIAPYGIEVRNPAFDITPAELVTAIITEKGIVKKPFKKNLKQLFSK
jgi:methylthioribose-1-phosphate isomerase